MLPPKLQERADNYLVKDSLRVTGAGEWLVDSRTTRKYSPVTRSSGGSSGGSSGRSSYSSSYSGSSGTSAVTAVGPVVPRPRPIHTGLSRCRPRSPSHDVPKSRHLRHAHGW